MDFLKELMAMRPDLMRSGAGSPLGTIGGMMNPGVPPVGNSAGNTPGINPDAVTFGDGINDWQPVTQLPPVGPAKDMPQYPEPMFQGGPIGGLAPNTPSDFNYDGASDMILNGGGGRKKITIGDIMQVLGPTIMAGFGNEQGANQLSGMLMKNRENEKERRYETVRDLAQRRWQDVRAKNQANLDASAPFSSGRDRVRYDPQTGQSSVIYDGAQDFEEYAAKMGFQPGTPQYFKAVEDFVLKGHGPTAFSRGQQMDDYRTDNDIRAEGVRSGNRSTLKAQPAYRDIHGAPPRQGSGGKAPTGYSAPVSVKTPAEAERLPKGTVYRIPSGEVKRR